MNTCRLTESEIIADIRRVARLLNHSPSSVEYMRHGLYHVRTLQKKAQTSWKMIVESAGLRYTPRTAYRIPSTEELTGDLLRVARLLGHPPTRSEYIKHGNFDSQTVRRRSGERRWEDAVASLTGLNREEVKRHQYRGGRRYRTTDEYFAKLREISQELGHAPTTVEAARFGVYAHDLRSRVGGKWEDILKAAGVDLSQRSKLIIIRATPTETLIQDVLALTYRTRRLPTLREYKANGHYPFGVLKRRLGGWRKVKEVVGQRLAEMVEMVPPAQMNASPGYSAQSAGHDFL